MVEIHLTEVPRQWIEAVVRHPGGIEIDGAIGTPLRDPDVIAALSAVLSDASPQRVTIVADGGRRAAVRVMITHDAECRPVALVTEWGDPSDSSPLSGRRLRYAVKVDPAGERVRVVFGSWHTAMRDEGRSRGLDWHSQRRRFEDGSATSIGWLSGPFTPEVQRWLGIAGLFAARPVAGSVA